MIVIQKNIIIFTTWTHFSFSARSLKRFTKGKNKKHIHVHFNIEHWLNKTLKRERKRLVRKHSVRKNKTFGSKHSHKVNIKNSYHCVFIIMIQDLSTFKGIHSVATTRAQVHPLPVQIQHDLTRGRDRLRDHPHTHTEGI